MAGSLNSRKLKFSVVSGGKKVLNTANICEKLSVKKLRKRWLCRVENGNNSI